MTARSADKAASYKDWGLVTNPTFCALLLYNKSVSENDKNVNLNDSYILSNYSNPCL